MTHIFFQKIFFFLVFLSTSGEKDFKKLLSEITRQNNKEDWARNFREKSSFTKDDGDDKKGIKERKGKERKGIYKREEEQRNGRMIADCPEAYVCSAVPTTYAQLSNDKTVWKHFVPCLKQNIAQSLWCWLGLDTYTHHMSQSIRPWWWQWVRWLRASLVIGAYNRWSHQSERQNDTRLPLYHLPWPLCTLLFLFLITFSLTLLFSDLQI